MIPPLKTIIAFALLGSATCIPALFAKPTADQPDASFGLLRDVPVYMQEWHVWWGFPFPDKSKPVLHLDTTYASFREPWRLEWNRNGYPYPGIYDSSNPEIIRWQLRCIKATGVTSVAVMLHPLNDTGLGFIQENIGLVKLILDLAAEEKFPVFFMDEVAFRSSPVPRDPAVMARRIIRFLGDYGAHPGFYKIDGKPVYYYQTYGYDVSGKRTDEMMAEVEKAYGPVHWMIFGDGGRMGSATRLNTLISGANLHRRPAGTRQINLSVQNPAVIFPAVRAMGKRAGDMHYPKFDGTAQPWRQRRVALYGDRGSYLATTLADSLRAKPDLLMLSSWNDYEEGAGFEPAWDFDGFTGDPYLYCRVLARLKGIEFVPPPPPPKEAVHPSIWEKLGYGDGAGPIIENVHRSHVRGGSLEVVVRDSASPVTALEAVWDGDVWWRAAQPGEHADAGNLKPPADALTPSGTSLKSPMNFRIGKAASVELARVGFRPDDDVAVLGSTPAVGVAYAFDPSVEPARVDALFQRRTPAALWEPTGGLQRELVLPLSPHNKAEDIGHLLWDGWVTRSAVAGVPIKLAKGEPCVVVRAAETALATVSLLGPPREERIVTVSPQPHDPAGWRVSYHLVVNSERLARPGVQFLWLRARDAAGNWGSPILYSFPNYEDAGPAELELEKASAAKAELAAKVVATPSGPGVVFRDDFRSVSAWSQIGGGEIRVTKAGQMALRGAVQEAKLSRPVGAFTARWGMRLNDWRQAGVLWITDRSGGKGVGVVWDSSDEANWNGEGHVRIVSLDKNAPPARNEPFVSLAQPKGSGRAIMRRGAAEFEFTRKKNGEMIVLVDGREIIRLPATGPATFERLFLSGSGAAIGPVEIRELESR